MKGERICPGSGDLLGTKEGGNRVDDHDFLRFTSVQENVLSGRVPNIIDHVKGGTDICASYVQAEAVQVREGSSEARWSSVQEKSLGGREREGGCCARQEGCLHASQGPAPQVCRALCVLRKFRRHACARPPREDAPRPGSACARRRSHRPARRAAQHRARAQCAGTTAHSVRPG